MSGRGGDPKGQRLPLDRQESGGQQTPLLSQAELPVQQALNRDGALWDQGLRDLGHERPA